MIKVDPSSSKVVWEYTGSPERPLFSETSGSVEALANGNLLIVESDQGRVIEVTPDREVVWEFQSPYQVRNRKIVAVVPHMDRVPRNQTMIPLDPRGLNSLTYNAGLKMSYFKQFIRANYRFYASLCVCV